jgi:uncharacterized protein (DUF2345 family)
MMATMGGALLSDYAQYLNELSNNSNTHQAMLAQQQSNYQTELLRQLGMATANAQSGHDNELLLLLPR